MNKEDEVKHYLIFHIDYQETINNKKEHVKTQLPLHIQDLLYPYQLTKPNRKIELRFNTYQNK